MVQKQTAKSWYSEVITDSRGNKRKAVTVVKILTDCEFKKVFAAELLQQIIASDNEDFPVKNLRKVLFIMTTILSMANKENMIYSTVNEFAQTLGMSPRTTMRYLNSFKKLGLIQNTGAGRWVLNSEIFAEVEAGDCRELVIQYRAVKSKKEALKNQRKRFTEEDAGRELAVAEANGETRKKIA